MRNRLLWSTGLHPVAQKRMKRLRWRLACLLNRHPRLCWVELGSWALYGGELRERRWANDTCLDECGSCWCNKRNPSEGRP
jgi:hypothetical protein